MRPRLAGADLFWLAAVLVALVVAMLLAKRLLGVRP